MSLYRGYFVPAGLDPYGQFSIRQNKRPPSTGQKIENCIDNCIHEFLIRNPEIYFGNPSGVLAACRQSCIKQIPLPPVTIVPINPPAPVIGLGIECGNWKKISTSEWTKMEFVEKDGCVCKYSASRTNVWKITCRRIYRAWDGTDIELRIWTQEHTSEEIATKEVLSTAEGDCPTTIPWVGPEPPKPTPSGGIF